MLSSFVPSTSTRRNRECRCSVKQGHQFARIRLPIQVRIGRQQARHHVDRLSDGHGHHPQVEGPKLPIVLTSAQKDLQSLQNRLLRGAAIAKFPVLRANIEYDFHDRHHLQAVGADVLDVRLDIGLQHQVGRGLRGNLRSHKVRARRVDCFDDLLDQLLLAAEVIGDHALADACSFGDLSQRGLGIAQPNRRQPKKTKTPWR